MILIKMQVSFKELIRNTLFFGFSGYQTNVTDVHTNWHHDLHVDLCDMGTLTSRPISPID